MCYLRTKAATDAIKFTVEVDKVRKASMLDRRKRPKLQNQSTSAPTAVREEDS